MPVRSRHSAHEYEFFAVGSYVQMPSPAGDRPAIFRPGAAVIIGAILADEKADCNLTEKAFLRIQLRWPVPEPLSLRPLFQRAGQSLGGSRAQCPTSVEVTLGSPDVTRRGCAATRGPCSFSYEKNLMRSDQGLLRLRRSDPAGRGAGATLRRWRSFPDFGQTAAPRRE